MIKNKYIKKILVMACIFSCINISTSYANISENYNFKNITSEDGLSQSTVETIYQDSKGYIWIGTNDGLDRYNGYEFKQYKYNKNDKNSIANNYIIDIMEDKDGNHVAFSGSMNESMTAMSINYETIDVFCDWREAEAKKSKASGC